MSNIFTCPSCGDRFETRRQRSNHRKTTQCIPLPDGVTVADLERLVAEHDTLLEIQRELRGPSRKRLKLLLGKYDLLDEFTASGRDSPLERMANAGLDVTDSDPETQRFSRRGGRDD